jgi:hypothetical protein
MLGAALEMLGYNLGKGGGWVGALGDQPGGGDDRHFCPRKSTLKPSRPKEMLNMKIAPGMSMKTLDKRQNVYP